LIKNDFASAPFKTWIPGLAIDLLKINVAVSKLPFS
jgi:hypothetical protein